MEGVFAGCDGNIIAVVALVIITIMTTTFLPPSYVAFFGCTMGNGWKHIPLCVVFISCNWDQMLSSSLTNASTSNITLCSSNSIISKSTFASLCNASPWKAFFYLDLISWHPPNSLSISNFFFLEVSVIKFAHLYLTPSIDGNFVPTVGVSSKLVVDVCSKLATSICYVP